MSCPRESALAAGALSANAANMTATISGPNQRGGPCSQARDRIPVLQFAPPNAELACESRLFARAFYLGGAPPREYVVELDVHRGSWDPFVDASKLGVSGPGAIGQVPYLSS